MFKPTQEYSKPFLKWAGGKSQLLHQFRDYFPIELQNGEIINYFEPFLGSGAVYFFIAQNYDIKKAYLSDINPDLIQTYKVIQQNVEDLIEQLKSLQMLYFEKNEIERQDYFYSNRELFNILKTKVNYAEIDEKSIQLASLMIFLNKTCFNGLFRQNKKGDFNVPFGYYKNPKILDQDNLQNVSKMLENAELFVTDFENIEKYITNNYFVYFDPPYKPISKTSSFTTYSKFDFTDNDQIRLSKLYSELDRKGNKIMLSNSDPKNENPNDDFFDNLYNKYNIHRVYANRMIN